MAEITRKKRTLVDDLKDFRTGKIGDKYYNNIKNANEYYYKDSGINYNKEPDNPIYGEVTTSSQNNKTKGIDSFFNSGNQMVNSVQNDFRYNENREYENKYKNYNYEQLKTSYKSAKDDREKNWILNKIKKDSSSEELQNWYDTLSQEYDSKLQQNPDPKISKEFEDKASEYEKLIKDKQHQETAQKNQKKDELYSDYYKNYDYEQLKKESENGRLPDYERSWLENAAYEKASSADLQTSYDNNEKTMKEIREQKKSVLEKQNKASSNEEKQSYIREASNLDEEYDSLYSKNETLKNQIEKKKYAEKKKAEYDDVIESDIKAKTIMQMYYNLQKYDEVNQDIANNGNGATGLLNVKSIKQAVDFAKKISPEEREKIVNDFNSLENKDTLYKYYKREREEQETAEINQILTDYSDKHPILGSGASVVYNTFGSVADTVKYAGAGIDKAFGGDGYINPDSTNVAKAQLMREKVSEDMDGLGKFFYNTTMSIGDNLARLPLLVVPGGKAMSLALAGTSAGVSSANEVINSGGSIESALLTGAAAGTAEVVFEKIPLDNLIKLKNEGTDSVFRTVVNQMKTEGLEEVGTDVANAITDQIINGDMSQLALQYQNYIAQGYSEDEAKKQIAFDFASQLGQSFAAGAISGGVMSGGTVAINKIGGTIGTKSEKRKTVSQLGREALQSEDFNIDELIKTAKKSDNPKAVNLANSLEKVVEEKGADKVKPVDVGNLLTLTNSKEITYDYSQDLSELTGTDKQNIIDSNFKLSGEENTSKNSNNSEVKYTDTKAFGENYPHGLGAKISKTGERINIVGIKSSSRDFNSDDNTVVLLSDNGELYDSDDIRTSVTYYNNLFDYAKNFDTIGARVYLSQYEDYVKRSKSRGKTADIAEYSESFERLYSYGVKGVTYDSIKKSGNFTREINILGAGVAYSAVQSGNNDLKVDTRDKSNKRQKIRMPGESNSISSKVYVDPGSEDSVKVTDEQLAVLQAVAENTGREIVLTDRMGERTGDENANGGYNPNDGKIYINAEVDDSYMLSVSLHEAVHGIAADNPAEYHALCTFITNYLVAKGENLDNLLDDIKFKWGDSVRSEDAVLEELVCQTVMAIATDEAAIKTALSLEENKGILKKVASALKKIAKAAYDFIKGVGIQAHNKQAQPWIDNIEALNELAVRLEKAFESTRKLNEQRASAAENKETGQKNNTHEGVKYSVGYTEDNKPVAIIDDDILAGVPKNQWIKTVKDTLSNKFTGGIPIKGRFIKVNRISKREYTNSKYSKYLRDNNGNIYKDKFRSANNIDDIVLASTNYINEDLKHKRKDNFKEFARGDVLIRVGKNDYSAKVIIGFTSSKQMVLYDIVDFVPENLVIKKESTPNDQHNEVIRSGMLSNKMIPQNNNNVKHSVDDSIDNKYLEAVKNTITTQDIQNLRSIGRKSINDFTSEDIQKSEKWARKFYKELGTKSPFFRAWFGDWRAYDNITVNTVNLNSTNKVARGAVQNKDTGFYIDVSKIGIDHIKVHLHNSKFAQCIINNLHDITENAVLLDTYLSEKTGKTKHINTSFMHSFYIPVEYDGKKSIIKLYVEEYYNNWNDKIQRRDYDVKKIETFYDADRFGENISTPLYASKNVSMNNISDLFSFVKQYDKEFNPKPVNPVMLNDDGTPKVFYHSTNENFTVFKKGERAGLSGKGIYFSPYQQNLYGRNSMPVYLKIENPMTKANEPDGAREINSSGFKTKIIPDFFEKYPEYDAIIQRDEVVVKDPNQIKSATDNIGTFDGNNPDIRYSKDDTIVDYSDLTALDDEEIKVYNKRGWANQLFTNEDRKLLEGEFAKLKPVKTQRTDNILGDGSRIVEVNNKIVLIGGTFAEPEIYCVFAINAANETEAEIYKGEIINELNDREKRFRCGIDNICKLYQSIVGKEIIRAYIADDFSYHKGQIDTGERATLPDSFKYYGYTKQFQDGTGSNRKAGRDVSEIKLAVDDTITDGMFADGDLFDEDGYIQQSVFERAVKDNPDFALTAVYNHAAKTAEAGLRRARNVKLTNELYMKIARRLMNRYEISPKLNKGFDEELAQIIKKHTKRIERGVTDFAGELELLVDDCKDALMFSGKLDGEALKTEREEILDYLRGKTLILTEYAESDVRGDYDTLQNYRKRMFGKINVAYEKNLKNNSKGMFWDSGNNIYINDVIAFVEEHFPYLITDDADDISGYRWLDNLVNGVLKPKFVNNYIDGFYENIDTAAIEMAFDVTTEVINEKAKLAVSIPNSEHKLIKEIAAANKKAEAEKKALQKAKLESYRNRAKEERLKRIKKVQSLLQKMGEITENNDKQRLKYEAQIEHLKTSLDKTTIILNMGYETIREQYNSNRERTANINSINKLLAKLEKRYLAPKPKEYIPADIYNPLHDVLTTLIALDGRSKKVGMLAEKMRTLINKLDAEIVDSKSVLHIPSAFQDALLGYTDEETGKHIDGSLDAVVKIFANSKATSLKGFGNEEIKQIKEALSQVEAILHSANEIVLAEKRYNAYVLSREIEKEIEVVTGTHSKSKAGRALKTGLEMFQNEMNDAKRFARRISGYKKDSLFVKIFDELNRGQSETMNLQMEWTNKAMQAYSEFSAKELDDYKHKKALTIRGIDFTADMLVEMALEYQDEYAREHMMFAGYHVPNIDYLNKKNKNVAYSKDRSFFFVPTKSDIATIRDYVKSNKLCNTIFHLCYNLYNEDMQNAVNEISLQKYGYKLAKVRNYCPITIDTDTVEKGFADVLINRSINSRAFLHMRDVQGRNRLKLVGALDKLGRQIDSVSSWCGMTIPIENFTKVYNMERYDNSFADVDGKRKAFVDVQFNSVLNRLANNEEVTLEEIFNLEIIQEAFSKRGPLKPTINDNSSERIALRKKVQRDIEKLGSAVAKGGKWEYNGVVNRDGRIDIVIGLPAAGKSSVIADPLSAMYKSRIVDSDVVKERLPEFNNGLGAGNVHAESKQINEDILEKAVGLKENIVLPIVGSNYDSVIKKIKFFKENGYEVYLHLNELPMYKALGRMINRFIETGRFLEPKIIYDYQNKPTEVFERILKENGGLIDGYSKDDNRGNEEKKRTGSRRIQESRDTGNGNDDASKRQDLVGRGVYQEALRERQRGGLIDGYSRYSNDVERGEEPIFKYGTEDFRKNYLHEVAKIETNPHIMTGTQLSENPVSEFASKEIVPQSGNDFKQNLQNNKPKEKDMIYFKSVKENIKLRWGNWADDYISKLMGKLQGATKAETSKLDVLTSNYTRGVLTGNINSAIVQISSYPLATNVVGWKPVAAGLKHIRPGKHTPGLNRVLSDKYKHSVPYDELAKYTPILWYRQQGHNNRDINEINKYKGLGDKSGFLDKLNWIEKMDTIMVDMNYWICYEYVKNELKISPESKEFMPKVAETLEEIINSMMPNSSIMQQGQILRRENPLMKIFTLCKSQVFCMANAIMDSSGEYIARRQALKSAEQSENEKLIKEAKADLKESKTKYIRTFSSVTVSVVMTAFLLNVIKAFVTGKYDKYKDEDGNLTASSVGLRMLKDFGSEFTGMFLFGDIIYNFALSCIDEDEKFWGVSYPGIEIINDLFTGINKLINSNERNFLENLRNIIGTAGLAKGLPIKNMDGLIQGIYNHFVNSAFYDFTPAVNNNGEVTTKKFANTCYNALVDGNKQLYNTYHSQWLKQKKSNGELVDEKYINSKLKEELEDDKEIIAAADAFRDGNLDKYEAVVKKYVGFGFKEETVTSAVDSIINEIEKTEQSGQAHNEEETEEEEKAILYNYSDAFEYLKNGDRENYERIEQYLIDNAGKTKRDVQSAMRSASRTDELWKVYFEAQGTLSGGGDPVKLEEYKKILTGIYGSWSTAVSYGRKYKERMKKKEREKNK